MRQSAKIFTAAFLCAIFCATGAIAADRVQTQLTADTMDYDMETGDFSAKGNVKIVREDVTLTADSGAANTKTQKARMWGNAHAYGKYEGEDLDAKCDQVDADFGAPGGNYTMTGDVDATFGQRVLRSKTANLDGQKFNATEVTHFEDKKQGVVLACDALDGDYDAQGVRVAHAVGHVAAVQTDETRIVKLWCDDLAYSREDGKTIATGNPKVDAERLDVTDGPVAKRTIIESDTMVHSWADNSVTATGNARARQDDRKITAEVLIYNPQTGKLDALGTPRITVDLSTIHRPAEVPEQGKSGQKKSEPAKSASGAGKRGGKK